MPIKLNWSAFQCKSCKALYKTRHHVEKHQKQRKKCHGIKEMTVSLFKGNGGDPTLELRMDYAETSFES